jgi:uncharacterized protein YkwD
MVRILSPVFLILFSLACVNPVTGQRDARLEALVHQNINRIRVEHGGRALRRDMRLDSAASLQIGWCMANQTLGHTRDKGRMRTPADRLQAVGYDWTTYGENLLYRSADEESDAELAALIAQQWVDSPGHYANLLDRDYHYSGTVVMRDADGVVWAGQVFATPARVSRPQVSARVRP